MEEHFAGGYEGPFYFSRRFRLHMGLSPTEYRAEFSFQTKRAPW